MTTMTSEITLKALEAIENIDTQRIEESYLEELSKFGEVLVEDGIEIMKVIVKNSTALPNGKDMTAQDAEKLFFASAEMAIRINEEAAEIKCNLIEYQFKALDQGIGNEKYDHLERMVDILRKSVEAIENTVFNNYDIATGILDTFKVYH